MNHISRQAVLFGLTVTLIACVLDFLGGFTPWERQSIDYRFAGAPRQREPMTDRIVHVDIDDGAIDSVGRWPWDRATLGGVIDELDRAGVKTIALDLLLTEPQQYPEGTEQREIDHDAIFAEALANATTVLAVDLHTDEVYDEVWRTPEGQIELTLVLDLLGENVRRPAQEVASRIVNDRRRELFLTRPVEFKRAAAHRVLERDRDAIDSFEAFERRMVPGLGVDSTYPEQVILLNAWDQDLAWQLIAPHLPGAVGRGTFKDRLPLSIFARGASRVGYVNKQEHADGAVREVTILMPSPGGDVLQFGLAAAAMQLDLDADSIAMTADRLTIGHVELPLNDGRLWIDWPTSGTRPRWEGLLRATDDARRSAGHVSIGWIVDLHRNRVRHENNLARRRWCAAAILQLAEEPATLDDVMVRDVEDQIEFELPQYEGVELSDEDRVYIRPMLLWKELGDAIAEGEVLLSGMEQRCREEVEGRLVFVGWTSTAAVADFVPTPIDARTPGVIVHSAVANMVLQGNSVSFLPPWSSRVLIIVMGLLCTLSAARFSTVPSTLLAGALLGGYVAVGGFWLFARFDIVIPMVAPVATGAASWIACTAMQAAISQRDRQRITRQFKARVSTQLVDHLVANPEAVTMTGEEREMTVIFGDLAGFTSISEDLGGAATVATLNRYMVEFTRVLIDEGAYVNKFLGDGVMAFWSAFAPDADQAAKGCRAALGCQRAVTMLNKDPELTSLMKTKTVALRLGLATGDVVVGDCGAPPALNDYTVIGDAVNLAARLESANKQFGTSILINRRTRDLLPNGAARLRPIGRVQVVGQERATDVYEVLPPETPESLVELSTRLVEAYQAADFGTAVATLDELEKRFGSSKLVDLYRETIGVVGDDFDGTLHLRDK